VRCAALLGLLVAAAAPAQDKRFDLIEFDMIDQFDDWHTQADYVGKTLVVVGGNKGSADYNLPWAIAIRDSLEASGVVGVEILGVADLRGVPWFLKGWIRGKFPKPRDQWALMDWNGEFAKAYVFEKNMSNILVFDPSGRLVHHAWGREIEAPKLDLVLRAIRKAAGRSPTAGE